jgi:hypothetical protein
MAFVNDGASFHLIDDALVVFGQWTTSGVSAYKGSVEAGLFEMPLSDF